jgi:hypothetical protein
MNKDQRHQNWVHHIEDFCRLLHGYTSLGKNSRCYIDYEGYKGQKVHNNPDRIP